MHPNSERRNVTQSVNTATGAPDSGNSFFSSRPLPGEKPVDTANRLAYLNQALEQVFLNASIGSSFFESKQQPDEANEVTIWRLGFYNKMLDEANATSEGHIEPLLLRYLRERIQLDKAPSAAVPKEAEIELGLLPFFGPAPLPNESKEKTKQRLQFIQGAIEAVGNAVTKFGTGVQQQLLLFVKQNSLFSEMQSHWDRKEVEKTFWEMFEALVRDEITADDWETRSTACFLYRWLQDVINTVYPMRPAA